MKARQDLEQVIEFDHNSITIDIPMEGVTIKEGWRIRPLYRPVVSAERQGYYTFLFSALFLPVVIMNACILFYPHHHNSSLSYYRL